MLERIERLMSGMKLATDSLAHDLRGPLTRLRGRIELALRRPADAAKDRDALADVLAEADAALAVFENLLKIATAEAGVTAADFAPVDLAALAGDAVDLYEPVAEEKAVVLELSAASAPSISGQADLLAQAVTNLLDNAVTHTPPAGKIVVSVDADGTGVALTVADSGPGIPEAERAHVLERFVRLTPGRGGRGAGLGLSLVAAVAKLHRAELTLADNNPGLRVRLRFLLPGADDRERGAGA
jgi:signal transduction histidine kinase